ncbi:MAG: peptidoglycan DD-metalloendopeptidase family protein [Stellaceae bacterium]
MLPWVQAALFSAVVLGTAGLSYLGVSRISYKRVLAAKDAAIFRAGTTDTQLRHQLTGLSRERDQVENEVVALRTRLGATETHLRSLDRAQSHLTQSRGELDGRRSVATAASATMAEQLAQLTQMLDQTRQKLQEAQATDAVATAQLTQDDAGRAAEQARLMEYRKSLQRSALELEQLGSAHRLGTIGRARLRVRLGEVWRKLSQETTPQLMPSRVTPAGSDAAAADAGFGNEKIAAVEHMLASTGIDVAHLLAQLSPQSPEGGPFVPPPKDGRPLDTVDLAKLEAIRGLARVLPLGAPLVQYQIGSPFGPRSDPFNHRAAFHTGIDLDAPYMSPVYATGPGTVVYAGYFGDYGKVVEINHGFGIETLYAHLHRCLVSVGEAVAAHAEIGLVGTTGRSTGPHVHYEVRVNGQPQDPEKFIALSGLIPVRAGAATPAESAPAESSH